MLYKDDVYDSVLDPFDVLNESIYLTIDESTIYSDMIPIIENSRLNTYLTESTYSYIPNTTVILDESDIIEDPTIIQDYTDYIVRPINEQHNEYQYILECIDTWIDNDYDDNLLLEMILLESPRTKMRITDLGAQEIEKIDKLHQNAIAYVQGQQKKNDPILLSQIEKLKTNPKFYDSTKSDYTGPGWQERHRIVDDFNEKHVSNRGTAAFSLFDQMQRDSDRLKSALLSDPRMVRRVVDLSRTKEEEQQKHRRSQSTQARRSSDMFLFREQLRKNRDAAERKLNNYTKKCFKIHNVHSINQLPEKEKLIVTILQARFDKASLKYDRPDLSDGFLQKYDNQIEKAQNNLRNLNKNTKDITAKVNGTPSQQNTQRSTGSSSSSTSPSQDPLGDKKGKPAGTPTPPPNNTPPKQDAPAVPSNNNNQSRLSRATTLMKNNKGKIGLGVGLAVGAGLAYKNRDKLKSLAIKGLENYQQYKNRPKSVIAKRIAALRGIYKKFMINAQRNPQKANVFKRMAAKILSVIDKLLHYMQNKADGTNRAYNANY